MYVYIFWGRIMDFIIANVEHIEFKIERDLNEQYGSLPLPFTGMDSKLIIVIIILLGLVCALKRIFLRLCIGKLHCLLEATNKHHSLFFCQRH